MAKTVMVFGLGEVGQWAIEFLARSEGVDNIFIADNKDRALYRMNGTVISSAYQGFSKKFEFHRSDISDIEATAKLLEKTKPDVILSLVVVQSPLVLRITRPGTDDPKAVLPEDIRDKLWAAGFSVFLPYQILLPAKLAQAVKKSGIQTHIVNASFPDVVGPVVWKHVGLGPVVGLGNHDIYGTIIRKHVSMTEGVPLKDVVLYFVGSHALAERGTEEGIPFFLKILSGDNDITGKYDIKSLFSCMPTNNDGEFSATAASGVQKVMALIRDTNELIHAPAPNGLIGGYPVRLTAKGAEVVLPKELTLEQAVKINEEAEKFDGIERIKDDGTVVYTNKTYSIMKELGYDCKELAFDELESRGKELKKLQEKWLASKKR